MRLLLELNLGHGLGIKKLDEAADLLFGSVENIFLIKSELSFSEGEKFELEVRKGLIRFEVISIKKRRDIFWAEVKVLILRDLLPAEAAQYFYEKWILPNDLEKQLT